MKMATLQHTQDQGSTQKAPGPRRLQGSTSCAPHGNLLLVLLPPLLSSVLAELLAAESYTCQLVLPIKASAESEEHPWVDLQSQWNTCSVMNCPKVVARVKDTLRVHLQTMGPADTR